jgi:hypothetical protein
MLRIVAKHAEVWNSAVAGLDAATSAGERLLAACAEIGRDPDELRWSGQGRFDGSDPEATVAEFQQWREAGFSALVIDCRGTDPVRAAEVAADKVLSAVRYSSSYL